MQATKTSDAAKQDASGDAQSHAVEARRYAEACAGHVGAAQDAVTNAQAACGTAVQARDEAQRIVEEAREILKDIQVHANEVSAATGDSKERELRVQALSDEVERRHNAVMKLASTTAAEADRAQDSAAKAQNAWQKIKKRWRAQASDGIRGPGRPDSISPELARRIWHMRFEDHMTLQRIADQLNARGIGTARGGKEWRPSSLQRVLRRPEAREPIP